VIYELLGPTSGDPIVLTPGGRFGKDVPGLRPLADLLVAGGMRVLLWDRPGCGRSDLQLRGESESHMRADVLAELLESLGLAPCVIAGGSGGARDSIVTAITHPEIASHLAVWNVTGGVFGVLNLAAYYLIPTMNAVRTGGIEAVLALGEWQQLVAANPRNEQILREFGADEFWRLMLRWLDSYVPKPGQTIPGVRDTMISEIGVPAIVIRGGEDDADHPKRTSIELHCMLKSSRLVEPPWPEDAWERAFEAELAGTGHMFDPWVRMAPLILEFAGSG
jgi:pimeloyl-ACP methyl ester carboxylesterase